MFKLIRRDNRVIERAKGYAVRDYEQELGFIDRFASASFYYPPGYSVVREDDLFRFIYMVSSNGLPVGLCLDYSGLENQDVMYDNKTFLFDRALVTFGERRDTFLKFPSGDFCSVKDSRDRVNITLPRYVFDVFSQSSANVSSAKSKMGLSGKYYKVANS
jgi:hypothetical protein